MNSEEHAPNAPQDSTSPTPDEPVAAQESVESALDAIDSTVESTIEETVIAPIDIPFVDEEDDDTPADDVPEDEPFVVTDYAEPASDYDLLGSDVDIDAALAAVANLSDAAAEREMGENAAYDAQESVQAVPTLLPMPPSVTLRRGTPASLIPAALLIVSGAVLTIITTSGAEIPTQAVAFGALAAVALLMLGYWLSAQRWARGTFFFALLLLISAAAVYAMTQPDGLGTRGLPLLVIGTGLSLLLTAVLARPVLRRALLPALLLILAGGVALGFSLGLLDARLTASLVQYAWSLPIILVVLWLLPVVFRRRAS
jgi:hypothetical protein